MFGHGQRRANIGYLRVISLFIRSKHQAPVRREQSDLSVCGCFFLVECANSRQDTYEKPMRYLVQHISVRVVTMLLCHRRPPLCGSFAPGAWVLAVRLSFWSPTSQGFAFGRGGEHVRKAYCCKSRLEGFHEKAN